MHLSDHDLRQLDDAYLGTLTPEQARVLLPKLVADLKDARERLAQNPSNSSRPPSSRAPWEAIDDGLEEEIGTEAEAETDKASALDAPGQDAEDSACDDKARRSGKPKAKGAGKPGRRKGAPGHSRTQTLPIDAVELHAPACCALCGGALDVGDDAPAHTASLTLDPVRPESGFGLVLQQTKHIYLEGLCDCGHRTRALPSRCEPDDNRTVAPSEWHLAGPSLVAFICALTQRMRLPRARVREFLDDWLGLSLSTATINKCVHEAARALEPVVDQEILEHVRNVELLPAPNRADATTWKEHGRLLWLWVFTWRLGPRCSSSVGVRGQWCSGCSASSSATG
jgi:transposase